MNKQLDFLSAGRAEAEMILLHQTREIDRQREVEAWHLRQRRLRQSPRSKSRRELGEEIERYAESLATAVYMGYSARVVEDAARLTDNVLLAVEDYRPGALLADARPYRPNLFCAPKPTWRTRMGSVLEEGVLAVLMLLVFYGLNWLVFRGITLDAKVLTTKVTMAVMVLVCFAGAFWMVRHGKK